LEEINKTLQTIERRFDVKEMFSESNQLIVNAEERVKNATNLIQSSFDRIHEKVFNFNNIMIAAYIALGTFPVDSPIIKLWTIIFPIMNLIFLIFIEIRQMEIHRFASNEMEWTSKERNEYGNRINKQTLLSLGSMIISLICLIYILFNLFW
jgi:hypothetical protein